MKRGIVTAVLVFICFILQTSVFELIKLAGITPNILLILISSVAVMRGQKPGMIVGFFCGLLMDIFYGSTIGGFAFLYMVFGFVDGFFNRIYYSDDNILPLVLIGVNDLIYGFIMYILCGLLQNHLRIIYYLKNIILPEMVYTVAVGLVCWKRTKRGVQILFKFKKKQEKDKTKLRGQIIELLSNRIIIIGVLLMVLFCLLIYRLFVLQIIQGDEHLANFNYKIKKTIEISGARGNIYDCNGKTLAYNQLAYTVRERMRMGRMVRK